MGVNECVWLCECVWVGVGIIVWVRRGVSGCGSLDCTIPLSVFLCVGVVESVVVIVWV